jgi:hypothetical protein
VEQLPGYISSSKILDSNEKEAIAGNLLFNEIYAKCDNQKTITNFFKKEDKETKTIISKRKTNVEAPIINKQMTLDFQKMNKYLIRENKEKEKEKEKEKSKENKNTFVLEL